MASNITLQNIELANKLDILAKQFGDVAAAIKSNPESADVISENQAIVSIGLKEASLAFAPWVSITEQVMDGMVVMAKVVAVRLFIKWGVFESIPKTESISYEYLAKKVGAEAALIRRVAWSLVSTGILKQIGPDEIAHTNASLFLTIPTPVNAVIAHGCDDHMLSLASMADYYDKYGLKEPTERFHTIFAYASGNPKLTVWDHFHRNPAKMTTFMTAMVAMASRFPTIGSYDFQWVVEKSKESTQRTLVVDVGGGKGHALAAIMKATPGLDASRCAIEDLAEVTQAAREEATGDLASAQFVPIDFHKEQPIKGAAAYYIRRCLHDYGDDDCVDILQHIQGAMDDDSRLLIVEEVLSNPPSPIGAASDLLMSTSGGKERTLDNWNAIASRAGLIINKTHPCEGSDVAVIELVKA